ncbi:phage head closure protein [Mesorhizobium marinum]|uniref:phage head closure protein n=1 Tax=Mesorhizobium marinum TaxID=3228790 RepID=UPI003467128C
MAGAGALDRRIVIERATVTYNAFNEPVQTWATHATVSAERKDVSDGERLAAGQVGSSLHTRFKIRANPTSKGFKPTDRVSYDGAIWSIFGIKETSEGRNRYLELTCAKDAD